MYLPAGYVVPSKIADELGQLFEDNSKSLSFAKRSQSLNFSNILYI